MIHIVTANNRHHYRRQLLEMHQLRRSVFVEERGWDLDVFDGAEYDDYDDDRAVYIMALDDEGHILASLRARPTDDKCMLTDVFPDLVGPGEGPVNGPHIWEITRVFSTPRARRQKRATGGRAAPVVDIMLTAMEWSQDGGIDRLIGVVDLPLYAPGRMAGWNIRMIGLPLDIGEGPIIAMEIANSPADIESIRRLMGRTGRTGYVVTDADIAVFGSLEKIQAEFDLAETDGRMMPGEAVRVFGARGAA